MADGGASDVRALPSMPASSVRASRRQLVLDSLGIVASAGGFGLVYGLSARTAGFSPIEATAMSVLVFAGASQFAAVGYLLGGFSWAGIVLLTAFINARHFLYAAALAPYLDDRPRWLRALMAHLLTDEAFALSLSHFRRIGRADVPAYWWAAIGSTFIPWNAATIAGVLLGGAIPEPGRFGLDVIFPAAMLGLAVGLITGRRELVAAIVGAMVAVAVSLAWDPAAGLLAGGLIGPLAGLATRPGAADREPEAEIMFGPRPAEMSTALIPLAILMGLVTYPWRAVPLLAPGIRRLPPTIQAYIRLVGPAILAALAAVNTMVVLDAARHPSFHIGIEWLAVGLCGVVVVARRGLLVGLVLAAVLAAVLRATGLAPLP